MSFYVTNNVDNCYICNTPLGPCRNSLGTLANFTQTPIADILENFFGSEVMEADPNSISICQECFITVEKYDELQYQSEEIQNKLTQLYSKTRNMSYNEAIDEDEDESSSCEVKLKCQKCHETFSSLREMTEHNHDLPTRRQNSKSTNNSSKAPKEFNNLVKTEGFEYNYEAFQRTFFSDRERRMKTRTGKLLPPKPPTDPNNQISKSFKKVTEQNGIHYDLDAFQRAFGFNETESNIKNAAKNAERRESKRLKQDEPDKPFISRRKAAISTNFVKTMEQNGISYDLSSFQKAFGYADSVEAIVKDDPKVTKECKELKWKGFIKCPECELTFTNRNNFLQHMKIHKPKDKSLHCAECNKYFKTSPCMQLHLATDHGRNNGPVDCPVCLRTYQDKSALRSHYYIHKMQRDFLCVRCGATFVHKKSFDMHNLMHDDIRPFACTFAGCLKKFRNSGKLKIHLRVHTGEKIYECPHCPGKRFAQKWGMDLHIKKQHKNEIIPNEICKICGISIQTKAKMRIHLANVHQVACESVIEVGGQQQYYDDSE